MEEIVLNKMREYVGWEPQKGDGIFSPGKLGLSNN
jgi:hypothetical protein